MIAQSTTTPMYPDAYLEDCADEFVALGLSACGITLLQYLADPDAYRVGDAAEPLLPEQLAVQQRLDAEAEAAEQAAERALPDVRCRGGALVEPLRHHAYVGRSPAANFRRRVARRSQS